MTQVARITTSLACNKTDSVAAPRLARHSRSVASVSISPFCVECKYYLYDSFFSVFYVRVPSVLIVVIMFLVLEYRNSPVSKRTRIECFVVLR